MPGAKEIQERQGLIGTPIAFIANIGSVSLGGIKKYSLFKENRFYSKWRLSRQMKPVKRNARTG
jgi:hypothetical protein